MEAVRKTRALVVWFAIYVPTTLFVTSVMFKSLWATGRGKVYLLGGLVALPAAVLLAKNTGRNRRTSA